MALVMLIKECERCRETFEAHRRLGKNQRVCRKAACQEWRSADGKRQWRVANPDYDKGSTDRHKAGDWKDYRLRHPESVKRNRDATRERLQRRRALFATQDSIRRNPVGYLQGLRVGVLFATQASTARIIDGILTYLENTRLFATQDAMDPREGLSG